MPVFNLHLVEGSATPAQQQRLHAEATAFIAGVLKSPLERIRTAITFYQPGHWMAGGVPADDAPFFSMIALEGRPLDERQRLLIGLTDIVVEALGVPKPKVRGCIWRIAGEDWGIGGVPASVLREAEIKARAEAAAHPPN
jgi:4-oxalocrotonate tautomerase